MASSNRNGPVNIINTNDETAKLLDTLGGDLAMDAMHTALGKCGLRVKRNMKAKLRQSGPHGPNQGSIGHSKVTGTYFKQSDKQKAETDARKSLEKSIISRVWPSKARLRKRGNYVLVRIGPAYQKGFPPARIFEYGGQIKLWGKDSYFRMRPRPFIGPAGAEVQPQMSGICTNEIKKAIPKIHRKAARELRKIEAKKGIK